MDVVSWDLLEELGIEFPAQDRWESVKAGISLDWLMSDAKLSERQRKAVERHLRGEKRIDWNYYKGIQKLKRLVAKIIVFQSLF